MYPLKKKGQKMQVSNNSSPSFKGFDYIPCIMNRKQIALAEKIYKNVANSDVFKKADECLVDLTAVPGKDNDILVLIHNIYSGAIARKNHNWLKTTFKVTDSSESFGKKSQKLLDNLNNYLIESFNIRVKAERKVR